MKIKTSELSGEQLDWAVKKAIKKDGGYFLPSKDYKNISHSTDWAHGGPILEREGIDLKRITDSLWEAEINANDYHNRKNGQTPLIAAMRCYVASRLGDEIEVPVELGAEVN